MFVNRHNDFQQRSIWIRQFNLDWFQINFETNKFSTENWIEFNRIFSRHSLFSLSLIKCFCISFFCTNNIKLQRVVSITKSGIAFFTENPNKWKLFMRTSRKGLPQTTTLFTWHYIQSALHHQIWLHQFDSERKKKTGMWLDSLWQNSLRCRAFVFIFLFVLCTVICLGILSFQGYLERITFQSNLTFKSNRIQSPFWGYTKK